MIYLYNYMLIFNINLYTKIVLYLTEIKLLCEYENKFAQQNWNKRNIYI